MLTELAIATLLPRSQPEIHPLQIRSIALHHLRVGRIIAALDQGETSLVPRPNQAFINLAHVGALQHDLGKLDIPYNIHEATKLESAAKYYKSIYDRHPANTILRLGGKEFVQQNPLLANLIYHHHPDIPQPPIEGLAHQKPTSPGFDWSLTYLIVADRIASANETHRFYNLNGASSQEETITKLAPKLKKAGLEGIINLPKAVEIGYKTFSKLGF